MDKRSYRRLPAEERRTIREETRQPGVTLSEVCRKHTYHRPSRNRPRTSASRFPSTDRSRGAFRPFLTRPIENPSGEQKQVVPQRSLNSPRLCVHRTRHPSRLSNFDRVRLRVVLRGDRKARVPERTRNIVRGSSRFKRQRRVQTTKGVRTDSRNLGLVAVGMQALVHPV